MGNRLILALLVIVTAGTHGVSATQAAAGSAALAVDGDVTKPLSLSAAQLKSLPRAKVEMKAENASRSVRALQRIQIVRLPK